MLRYRFESSPPRLKGKVVEGDAREASKYFRRKTGTVKLIITSPPYIDITNYREDQWLRLWFLGGPSAPSPSHTNSDDRHRKPEAYWKFLAEAWGGIAPLLSRQSNLVIRIGGSRLSKGDLADGLLLSLMRANLNRASLVEMHSTEIRGGQRRSFTSSKSLRAGIEHDFRLLLQG